MRVSSAGVFGEDMMRDLVHWIATVAVEGSQSEERMASQKVTRCASFAGRIFVPEVIMIVAAMRVFRTPGTPDSPRSLSESE